MILKDDNPLLFFDESLVLQLVVNCAPRERLGFVGERGLAF